MNPSERKENFSRSVVFFTIALFLVSASVRSDEKLTPKSFPAGQFKEFALGGDPQSASQVKPGAGIPPKILEKGDAFIKVEAASGRATIHLPLGWEVFYDSQKLRFGARQVGIWGSVQWYEIRGKENWDFKTFREKVIELNQKNFAEQKVLNPGLKYAVFEVNPGGFGYQWENLIVGSDDLASASAVPAHDVSLMTVYLPDPKTPGYAVRINLNSSPQRFDKVPVLMGLLLNNLKFL